MSELKYTTYREIEGILEKSFLQKRRIDILALYEILKDRASQQPLAFPPAEPAWGHCSDAEFRDRIDIVPLLLQNPATPVGKGNSFRLSEEVAFSVQQGFYDLMVHRQYNFLLEHEHSHNYVETYYVFSGQCHIYFPDRDLQLQQGDMIFIAPQARHRVESFQKRNFIIDLSTRATTFESLFRQQLSYDALLSAFFRKIIYEKADLNYILFHTKGDEDIKMALKNIAMETSLRDAYNEILYTSWSNIIFSTLLRKYYNEVETDPPLENNNFSRILKYISDHFNTVSLDELAEFFNYSKPHICNLIKTNTGRTLTSLVNEQKLLKAKTLLETTDYSIEEITELIGFTSSDHFLRIFRKAFGVTPGKYRKQIKAKHVP